MLMGMRTHLQHLIERLTRHGDRLEKRPAPPAPDAHISARDRFLAGVRSRVGGRYCTPSQAGRCTDCSGLVCEEYRRATGRTIPCGSHEQYRDLAAVSEREPRPGDLLYYDTGGGTRAGNRASHVGVYLGAGRAIHAMNETQGIIETDATLPYWHARFLGARRLPFDVAGSPPAPAPQRLPMTGQTPFRQTGNLSQERIEQILAGTPLAAECAAIAAACAGLAALPVAQSWLESRYGQDAVARDTCNPLGLLDYSGAHPVRWIGNLPLRVFPTWAAAFAEWQRRVTDPSYKEGVYLPWEMTLEQYIVTYVAGPGCWQSRGAACANGESWESCQRYLARTVARLNRYHGLDDPEPSFTPPSSPGVPLRRAIIPAANPNRPGTPITPSWITIHETGNPRAGANAESHRDFTHRLRGGPERVSFHYVVDDREAIQLLEHDEMAWHAGDGCDDPSRDTGCFRSIAIETCVNEDGDWPRARRNLVALVQHILRADARFSAERIAPHHRWSGKDCPHRIRAEGSWDRLLHEIRISTLPG